MASPGLKQVSAALETFLALQQRCDAAQLLKRIGQNQALELAWLQQRRQTGGKCTVFQQQLIGQQTRKIKFVEAFSGIITTTDRLQSAFAEV